MQYRSTNVTQGFGHTGGAIVIGVEAGSGVEINPNSSGNAPNIMPAGDETNKGITLQSKGTGTITIGSSNNQPIVLTSTSLTFGAGSPTIAPAGSGTLTLTNSSLQPLVITSTAVQIGNSTTSIAGIQQYRIDWAPAALSSLAAAQSTITVAGLATNSALFFTCQSPGLSNKYNWRVQCSTANELRFTEQNVTNSSIGTGESTAHGLLLEIKF